MAHSPQSPSPMDAELGPLSAPVLDSLLSRPDAFLRPTPALSDSFLKITQTLYGLAKHSEPFPNEFSPLETLLVDGFDAEQVWEQLQLQNEPMLGYLAEKVEHVLDEGDDDREDGAMSDSMDMTQSEIDAMDIDGMSDDLEEDGDDLEAESDEDLAEDGESDGASEINGAAELSDEDGDDWNEELGEAGDAGSASEEEDSKLGAGRTPQNRSEIDDDFFSLEEMERFADFGEDRDLKKAAKSLDDDEEDDDEEEYTFGDAILNEAALEIDNDNDEDNANDIRYEDFFGPREHHPENLDGFSERPRNNRLPRNEAADRDRPISNWKPKADDIDELPQEDTDFDGLNINRVANLLADDEDADLDPTSETSRFEKQQDRIANQISRLEEEALGTKSWTLQGEAGTKARPMNSLLEEDLEYEHAAKPVPVITEEVTATLEDLIKQRIKDGLFDDVVRKAPPRDRKYDPNRRMELNDQKSAKGLAEVLEDDYLRRTAPAGTVRTEKDEALARQHAEIDGLFATLCADLDALSNWHFTPAPVSADLEITALPNVPALEMEEVTPSHVAQGTLTAPKEVFAAAGNGSTRSALKSDKELTANDKKRLRDASRKSAGRVKKSKQDLRDAAIAARPRTAADDDSGKPRVTKETALKQLMGQKNVTIVADAKMKAGMKGVRDATRKPGKNDMRASVVEKGGKVGEMKKVERGQNLRL
ncbi:u3 small nucleolar ribonucleoprotein MPP10 [Geranomyces variabilis]|nr:u3 small nucleolar ribonucleoprotein MPP10 [Geranomyces variabilis]